MLFNVDVFRAKKLEISRYFQLIVKCPVTCYNNIKNIKKKLLN